MDSDDDERNAGGKRRRVLPMAVEGASTSGLRVSFLIVFLAIAALLLLTSFLVLLK